MPKEQAEEFEPTQTTIRNWLKQADRDEGVRSDGPTTEEKEKIRQFRKKLRQIEQERDILAKATAWFARETEDVPPKSSDSWMRTRPNFRLPPCVVFWKCPGAATMRGGADLPPSGPKRTRC